MNSILVAVLVCTLSGQAFSVNLDEACSSDSECPTNGKCQKDFTNCQKGKCTCNDNYKGSGDDTTCLAEKGIDEACSVTTYCLYGAECDSGTNLCKCPSGQTYNSALKQCITTGTKAISETCTAETECYGYSSTPADNMVECVAASGSSTKYCRCLDGYKTDNSECRKPEHGESCTTSIGCVSSLTIGASQETETCTSGTCACPSTADKHTIWYRGTTYKYCLTFVSEHQGLFNTAKYTAGNDIANGETCTASNSCASHYCNTCPGASGLTCLKAKSGAMKTGVYSLFSLVATILVASFF